MTMLADVKWPITYLITGGTASDQEFEEDLRRIQSLVSAAIEGGVTMVQLREKKLSGKHLFELTSACAGLVRDSSTKLLVNDRTDIAVGARADGVHLTETSIPVAVIREKFGSDLLIGASVHSVDDAKAAAAGGADFAIYGPVFDSPGKGPAVGLEGHRLLERQIRYRSRRSRGRGYTRIARSSIDTIDGKEPAIWLSRLDRPYA
jgi:thiamine-phosphate diphosphorylase